MIEIRRAADRGYAERSWLKSWHSFSFADYYDPDHMKFGHLRVINDDIIAASGGFPTHPHKDMEIISYVLEGSLEHKDSMGNGSVMRPGEVQRMSAGTGVAHSEFNPSESEHTRLLQIWIVPDRPGHDTGYEQKVFPEHEKRGKFRLVVSRDGKDNSVSMNQDVNIHAALIDGDERISFELDQGRKVWLQVARGNLQVNGLGIETGDGAAVMKEDLLEFTNPVDAEILLFDMAYGA